MRIICLATIILIAIAILSCRSTRTERPQVSDPTLTFGSGGGFAGLITEYSLGADGLLLTRKGIEGPWTEIGKVDKRQAEQIYQQINVLQLDSYAYNHPGNKYQFISIVKTPGPNRIVWGAAGNEPKKEVVIIYQILMDLVKKTKGIKK